MKSKARFFREINTDSVLRYQILSAALSYLPKGPIQNSPILFGPGLRSIPSNGFEEFGGRNGKEGLLGS